jgi:hypothetical protein
MDFNVKTCVMTLLVLLAITPHVRAQSTFRSQSLGQGIYDARIQRINGEVLAASTFPRVTFVMTYDDIPEQALVPGTLETLVSAKDAIQSGKPSAEMAGFINGLLAGEHGFEFNEAKLLNLGEAYIWVLSYTLFARQGGSSGIPFEWQSVVTHAGTVIYPKAFLQSHFPIYDGFLDDKQTVFCTLPLESLTGAPHRLSAESLKRVEVEAKAELLSAFREAGREYDIKHKSSVCVPFPSVMPLLPGTEPRIAWAIGFEFDAGMKDPSVFQVWATDHGALGKFSVGTWDPSIGEPSDAPKSR